MDFSVIFQLRSKKFWWMDIIFYFVMSLFIATILCYLIFLIKNNIQREGIQKEMTALQTVGTDQQKDQEKEVIDYKGKISDFSNLLKNHEFASNTFAFMQTQTMPNVWFKQFSLDEKNAVVQLSGESDDMDAFSRQVAAFEKNKYVKRVGSLSSSLGASARIEFNITLTLDQNIFSYLSDMTSIMQTMTPAGQSLTQQGQTSSAGSGGSSAATNLSTNSQQTSQTKSSEKLITSFHILHPEVQGQLDETNYTVTLNVPYGTDIKNLTPEIIISPGATVLPASDVSQNFTSPVTYTVTAQDGSVQNYTVKVVVASPPGAGKKSNQSGSVALIIIVLIVVIAVAVGVFLFFRKKIKPKDNEIT